MHIPARALQFDACPSSFRALLISADSGQGISILPAALEFFVFFVTFAFLNNLDTLHGLPYITKLGYITRLSLHADHLRGGFFLAERGRYWVPHIKFGSLLHLGGFNWVRINSGFSEFIPGSFDDEDYLTWLFRLDPDIRLTAPLIWKFLSLFFSSFHLVLVSFIA